MLSVYTRLSNKTKAPVTDIVDRQTRSRMMSGIKAKNTNPEIVLRRALHKRGFRFRLHPPEIPGRPDLVLAKYNATVFVHGCFWHRHEGCRYATMPSTRAEFWQRKFEANIARDAAVRSILLVAGWRVATLWECALRKPQQVELAADKLGMWLVSSCLEFELGSVPKDKST